MLRGGALYGTSDGARRHVAVVPSAMPQAVSAAQRAAVDAHGGQTGGRGKGEGDSCFDTHQVLTSTCARMTVFLDSFASSSQNDPS